MGLIDLYAATPPISPRTSGPTSGPTAGRGVGRQQGRSRWRPERPAPPLAPPDADRFRFVDPPAKTAAAQNLFVIIHGWVSSPTSPCYTDLQVHLKDRLGPTWDVWNYDWSVDSHRYASLVDDRQEATAEMHGQHLAHWIAQQRQVSGGYRHVQLLGLSLGSRVANAASIILSRGGANTFTPDGIPTIHLTFQDAWTPHGWYLTYGQSATWAEHDIYYGDVAGNVPLWPRNTDRQMPHARNFNVTYDDVGYDGRHNKHSGPIYWYDHTVRTFHPGANRGFGFDLCKANWPRRWPGEPASMWAPAMNVTLCADPDFPVDATDHLANHAHDRIVSVMASAGVARLNELRLHPRKDAIESADAAVEDDRVVLTTGAGPAWATFLIDFTSPVNALAFRFQFSSAELPATHPALGDSAPLTQPVAADGLLSVCIDGKLLTLRRELFHPDSAQSTGDLMLDPADDAQMRPLTGPHILSFRLDPTFAPAMRSRAIITDIQAVLLKETPASGLESAQ
jgi:hypothetical protein